MPDGSPRFPRNPTCTSHPALLRRRQASHGRRAALAGAALLLLAPRGTPAQEWEVLAQPTIHDLKKLSFVSNLHGWAAGDSGTILVTTDGGSTWSPQISPVDHHVVDLRMLDAQLGWALAQQLPAPPTWEYGTTLIRTTNGGTDWFVQSTFEDLLVHALDFTDAQWGCTAGEQGNLWWTSDGGASWTPSVVDSAELARWPIHEVKFHTATYGMATGGLFDVTGLVWRTTDGGQFWTHQRVAGEPFFGIHFFDSLDVLCVGGDLDYGAGMVQTTTGGAQWEYTYLGIWGRATAVSFRTASEGWAPLGFAGTYMKTGDGGSRWDATPTPGGTAMYDVLFTDSGTGYMAGEEGTILRYIGDGSAVGAPVPVPRESTLRLRVDPSPFWPETRVRFRLPGSALVSLRIYDVGGREITTLVEERLPGGTHSRTFDGSGLPNGVYFCRLVTGRETETRKVHLVR
jgi:photosystem II stability/assembly factor-like uncharacterized protein